MAWLRRWYAEGIGRNGGRTERDWKGKGDEVMSSFKVVLPVEEIPWVAGVVAAAHCDVHLWTYGDIWSTAWWVDCCVYQHAGGLHSHDLI